MTSPARVAWLDLGLEQLASEGLPGLTISRLCSAAGKTTGSFYHHFSDHQAFVLALIERWKLLATDRIVDAVRARRAGSGLRTLNELVFDLDPVLEVRVRQVVESEPTASAVLAAVDEARLDFLAELYRREGGAAPELARDLATLDYSTFLGFALLGDGADRTAADRLARLQEDLTSAYLHRPQGPTRTG